MENTQKILAQYGVSLIQLARIFPDLEELISLVSTIKPTKETAGTLQSIDLQLSTYLSTDEAKKQLKKVARKQKKVDTSKEEAEILAKEGELGGLGAIISDDELDQLFEDLDDTMDESSVKLLHKKTFVGVDISAFFTEISGTSIPMVDEDLNLIVRRNDLVIQAVFSDEFRASLQVSSETPLPLNFEKVNLVVSSFKKMLVDDFTYGDVETPTESLEEQPPSKENDSELSAIFGRQLVQGAGITDLSFASISNRIAENIENLVGLDLTEGVTIHPFYTPLSNFYYPPTYLYGLEDCVRFEQVGLDSGSYTSNICDATSKQRLTIYERGGAHLNDTVEGMENSIANSANVDEQFESYISPTLNTAFKKGSKAYLVGFVAQIMGQPREQGAKDGGYFVYGANGIPNFMFVPAVIVNYFAKYYSFDNVVTYFGKKSSRVILFEKASVVVGYYILPDDLVITLSAATRIFPVNPKETAEKTYTLYLSDFESKINLAERLGIDKEVEEGLSEEAAELIDDTEFFIDIFAETPDSELQDDIEFNIEVLEDIAPSEVVDRIKTMYGAIERKQMPVEETVITEEIQTEDEDLDVDILDFDDLDDPAQEPVEDEEESVVTDDFDLDDLDFDDI